MYPLVLKISLGFSLLETFSKIASIKTPSKNVGLNSIAKFSLLKLCCSLATTTKA